ncbi:hypothetical protein DFJ58DRAFT_838602 [Suillus subalutaceus]|uniref:uncharacterized protein n=1 Tax=Suillus subalutaceus TaxID=48586 RepID=UPI001B86FCEE|nr:uncharacterized protein DFJ58DRAFT_838602 [Suillus subalutaceus]KAG1865484.1 hypothetical protein DFJ58DRAFT_838602 [Suillus subalutaceus]
MPAAGIPKTLVETGTLGELWDKFGVISDLIPFTNNFPQADIHQLIAPDILHQIIKGTFKDHLVVWVEDYLMLTHGKRETLRILDDIDHRIATVASFFGLHCFPQGRSFKQWMGDDSKALMKVYLAAIEGHVPQDVIFKTTGVVDTFSLPRQHSLVHYAYLIRQFGAPNGLCSSITKSKHIKAIKEPWRRSSKYKVLGQMLVTNQRLDKLAAVRADFANCRMLDSTCLAAELDVLGLMDTDSNDNPNVKVHPLPSSVADEVPVAVDHGPTVLQTRRPDDNRDPLEVPLAGCPRYEGSMHQVTLVELERCKSSIFMLALCGGMKLPTMTAFLSTQEPVQMASKDSKSPGFMPSSHSTMVGKPIHVPSCAGLTSLEMHLT